MSTCLARTTSSSLSVTGTYITLPCNQLIIPLSVFLLQLLFFLCAVNAIIVIILNLLDNFSLGISFSWWRQERLVEMSNEKLLINLIVWIVVIVMAVSRSHWYVVIVCLPGEFDPRKVVEVKPRGRPKKATMKQNARRRSPVSKACSGGRCRRTGLYVCVCVCAQFPSGHFKSSGALSLPKCRHSKYYASAKINK